MLVSFYTIQIGITNQHSICQVVFMELWLIGFYYFTTVSGYLYRIIKTSLTSPTIFNSYGPTGKYRGLYYDSSISRIIAAGCDVSRVDCLDLNLNLIISVPLGNNPHGIAVYWEW